VVADWVRRNLGLPSLGVVRAVHTARETKLDGTDALNLGEGLTEAIRMATSEGCERDELVDAVYCDLNGERYRSEEWGFAALRCQDAFRDPSPRPNGVAAWGGAGAASGALLTVLAVQAWQRGYARGPRALVCAGSDQGLRAAALLRQQESKTRRK
jgi:3-oxoacyl-[acyl-carrier-protein] synthase-1